MKSDLKNHVKLVLKGWIYPVLIAVLVATSFKSAIADWNIVPTGSMKPTILEGDRIFINKLAYDLKIPYTTVRLAEWDDPQRGDIVVFYSPHDGERLVKRVVGIPGDVIAMYRNQLIINGETITYKKIDESNLKNLTENPSEDCFYFTEDLGDARHPVMITPENPAPRSFGRIVVPPGKYFMMGDNRDNSSDSRYFGFVDRNKIVGQATSIVISLDVNHKQKPRWKRFFTELL